MTERLCEGCGELLGSSRRNRRYHDARCRKAAWMRRQRERETTAPPPAPALDRDAVIAEALSEPRLLIHIAQAARTNWRAAAWMLERRYPEHWARGVEPEPALVGDGADPFAEVDELAQRRRRRI